jgi:hypothetical protein
VEFARLLAVTSTSRCRAIIPDAADQSALSIVVSSI